MSVFQLPQDVLRAFEQAIEVARSDVEESRKDEERKAAVAGALGGVVRQCTVIPDILRRLWDSTFDLLKARLIDHDAETRQGLQDSFARGQHVLKSVADLVGAFEQIGGKVEGRASLERAVEEVRRLEADIFPHWPQFTEQDLEDARTAYERGECLPLDEAFAQIAGVDKETWLRRVEERKRVRRP
jgi:hypothetical protein